MNIQLAREIISADAADPQIQCIDVAYLDFIYLIGNYLVGRDHAPQPEKSREGH